MRIDAGKGWSPLTEKVSLGFCPWRDGVHMIAGHSRETKRLGIGIGCTGWEPRVRETSACKVLSGVRGLLSIELKMRTDMTHGAITAASLQVSRSKRHQWAHPCVVSR